ncbi:MAG: hypothetical protein ACXAC7_21910 [Candidatus Hodarchaeales archaeon]
MNIIIRILLYWPVSSLMVCLMFFIIDIMADGQYCGFGQHQDISFTYNLDFFLFAFSLGLFLSIIGIFFEYLEERKLTKNEMEDSK